MDGGEILWSKETLGHKLGSALTCVHFTFDIMIIPYFSVTNHKISYFIRTFKFFSPVYLIFVLNKCYKRI
jgi:hypothetical protein